MNWQHYWKAILAFLALLVTNVSTRLVANGEPLPQTGEEWVTFAATTVGGTWLVYRKANAPKVSVPTQE